MLNGRNELFLGFISKEKRNDKTRKDIESGYKKGNVLEPSCATSLKSLQ